MPTQFKHLLMFWTANHFHVNRNVVCSFCWIDSHFQCRDFSKQLHYLMLMRNLCHPSVKNLGLIRFNSIFYLFLSLKFIFVFFVFLIMMIIIFSTPCFFFCFLTTNLVGYDRLQLFLCFEDLFSVILRDCILLENKPFHPFLITNYPTKGLQGYCSLPQLSFDEKCGTSWKSQQLITGLT